MRQKFAEHITLFASVVKWACYASGVGVVVGIATALFLKILALASGKMTTFPHFFFFLPLALVASTMLVKWLAPDAQGHGTEKVIEAIHQRMGRIKFAVVPVKLAATVITLACGGSAGKEGPCAQIGAGLASSMAGMFRLDDTDRRKLVICGISAGFATVFGTPVAGALFGVEVLILGQMMYDVLFSSFVSGIVGYRVALLLGLSYPHQMERLIPPLTSWSFLEVLLLGIWCGMIALMLIETMKFIEHRFEVLSWHPVFKALAGGALLVGIGALVSPNYLGLGLDQIESGLQGNHLPTGAVFWKSIATAITLGCGGSGGVVTPVFFVGTAAGNLFAHLFNENYVAAYSAIGMAAVLAGAANTPIAASVMAIELFGSGIAADAALACIVSFLMVGYRSIYPSQLLGIQKSNSLTGDTGKSMAEIGPIVLSPHQSSLITKVLRQRKKTDQQADDNN